MHTPGCHGPVDNILALLKYADRPNTRQSIKTTSLKLNCPNDEKSNKRTGVMATTPALSRSRFRLISVILLSTYFDNANKIIKIKTGGTKSNPAERLCGSVLLKNKHKNIAPSSAINSSILLFFDVIFLFAFSLIFLTFMFYICISLL